ncbi:MAG: hypothetical protein ACK4M0_08155 [Phreatobacter sp.]
MTSLRIALAVLVPLWAAALPAHGQTTAPPAGDWQVEVGTRAFLSGGRLQKTLFDSDLRHQVNSRLTYGSTVAGTGELFGRVDLPTGWFVKGYAGIGTHSGGLLTDEDYPPAEAIYSKTLSGMRNGRIDYGSLDAGFVFWRSGATRIGGFVGLHHFKEKYSGYGCVQVAPGGDPCATPLPGTVLVLSETARWTSLRLGLVADVELTDRLRLTAEVAAVPYARLDAFDNHWLRPAINPMAETGQGYGVQMEMSLSYRITERFSVGAGGRSWQLATTGAKTRFPDEVNPSRLSFQSERWGGFVQASYRERF